MKPDALSYAVNSTPLRARLSFILMGALIISTSFLGGCSENRDSNTPDGALRLFALALSEPQQPKLESMLSADTLKAARDVIALTKRVEAEIKRFPTADAQAWARSEALGTTLNTVSKLSNEGALIRHLMRDKLAWVATQAPEEIEQGFSAKRTVEGDEAEGVVSLLTRAGDEVKMKREELNGEHRWVVSAFEAPLQAYVQSLKTSLSRLGENRSEWRRRMRLELALPKIK